MQFINEIGECFYFPVQKSRFLRCLSSSPDFFNKYIFSILFLSMMLKGTKITVLFKMLLSFKKKCFHIGYHTVRLKTIKLELNNQIIKVELSLNFSTSDLISNFR